MIFGRIGTPASSLSVVKRCVSKMVVDVAPSLSVPLPPVSSTIAAGPDAEVLMERPVGVTSPV